MVQGKRFFKAYDDRLSTSIEVVAQGMQSQRIERILLWAIKIGLFIVPFVPLLIAPNMFFPYITGKAFLFRAIVELTFFAWAWLAIFYPKYRPRKTPLMWAVFSWFVIVTLATIFGINPARSFWSNFERMEGLLAYAHLVAYFIVLSHVFRKKDWIVFLHLSVAAGILQATYALFQRLGVFISPQGGFRADGTIGNPTYLAAYLMFIVAFALILWIYATSRSARYYLLGATLFILVAIYFTASRGPTLALLLGAIFAAGLLLLFMRSDTPRARKVKRVVYVAAGLLILVPAGLWLARDTSFVRESPVLIRLTSLSFKERTITSRFTIWNMSWEGFKERPLLGWGPENYLVVFSKHYRTELWQQEPWFDRSHNIVFDWLINAGILGLIAYFSMFVSGAAMLWKNFSLAREAANKGHAIALEYEANKELHVAITLSATLFAYVFQNFFVFDNIATYTSFFAILAFIQSTAFAHHDAWQEPVAPATFAGSFEVRAVSGAVFAAALMIVLYVINIKPMLVNLALLEALKAQSANDVQRAYNAYDRALSYDTSLGRMEIGEQFSRFALAAGTRQELSTEFRTLILRRSIELADRIVQENPTDPRSRLFLAIILTKVGIYDKALEAFNEALKLAPMKHQVYFELADAYLQMGQTQKAVEVMEDIYAKTKNFDAVGMNLVAVHILAGNQERVDALLMEHFGTVDVADELLARVYQTVGKMDRFLSTLRAFVNVDPENVEYRLRLASAYHKSGNNSDAMRELRVLLEKHPELKDRVQPIFEAIAGGKRVDF